MQRKIFTPFFLKREVLAPAMMGQQTESDKPDAAAVLRKLGACELRSAFAQAIFRSQRKTFRSESEFRKTVGQWVAHDIATDVQLRMEMQRLGYRPHERGYTLPQRLALVRFYMGKLKNCV